ncbi:uncharacterized protein LOC131050419 isoform X2 [Cryptomeria japonica]|uniref:uncharacterized protein LOC131050419 isoform X2 n=1 Tax=Cryptomeria japonica TaxID=3369 RepID=UPI0027DA5587|nr:uncharacterized protein LOC131050419 isoform X2 [Cryptomeria japonica]
MEDALLEEWLEKRAGARAGAGEAITAREIAESWSILRNCLEKQKGGVLQDGDCNLMLIALNKLSACRRTLRVALPQAKLLLSLLSSSSIPREARSVAAVVFTLWLRKSPATLKPQSLSIEAAIEAARKKSTKEDELLPCERMLLLGCLSAAQNVNLSLQSREICLEEVAEILSGHKQEEGIVLSNSQRTAEALSGAGYALLSSAHSSRLFPSILHSLLSLWNLHHGFYASIQQGLMLLHLMEWLGLNLIRAQDKKSGINAGAVEFRRIAGLGHPALDFAAVMAAGGFLRALRTSRDSEFTKDSVVVHQLEETVIAVAGTVASNFDAVFEPLSAQFPKWVDGHIHRDKEALKRRLVLQCTAVAISHCGGVSSHANVLKCLVATLLSETFPLGVIYSPKMTDVDEHLGSVFFKEGGAMTRAMCDQYLWASRDLKKVVEHLMWEFSYTLHQNHRLFIGASNLLSSEFHWYKDELQTARIFFYLRILPACMEKISGALFQLEVAPLMFLYMQHPDKNVVQGSHSVFVAFIQASNLGLDSSNVDKDDAISLKEQLVVYYVQTALEAYPCLTPFKALSSAVGALVRHLPAGSPAVLYCINGLVEKLNSLYNSHFVSSMNQGAEVEGETEALKNLQALLLNLILLVDIQVLPDLLKLLAQLIGGLPKNAQNVALGDAHDLVACSDDVTRKPILVPWLQSLAFICSGLNFVGGKTKKMSDESSYIDGNNLQLKPDTDKSGSLSFNPTCQNHLEHLSRL